MIDETKGLRVAGSVPCIDDVREVHGSPWMYVRPTTWPDGRIEWDVCEPSFGLERDLPMYVGATEQEAIQAAYDAAPKGVSDGE